MEVSALRYPGAAGRYGRSPLLKLQSDERLVAMVRRGNQGAFEVLVARYHARLLSFCRHMVGSREDAEDVLQDVLTASYNAILADDRAINVRPWLYRIARNRCLNHLRRNRAVGVDSMDIHFAEHGATTADKVHEREEFRQLLHDIRDLPETQRTALVLREMDALSYEQIAEAMETTVSSVKSLLVRARVSLTEAAEARLLSCDEVREELAEIAEGLRRKQSPSVRRHVKNCARCEVFQGEMRKSSRALAALSPIGPLAFFHKLLFAHAAAHTAGSAGAGVAGAAGAGGAGGAGAAGAGAAGAGAAGAAGAVGGASSAGLVTAGVGAVATKAAAGIAAAALVTAGTVAIDHGNHHKHVGPSASTLVSRSLSSGLQAAVGGSTRLGGAVGSGPGLSVVVPAAAARAVQRKTAVHATPAIGSTPPNGSQGTPKAATATKVVKTDDPARTQKPTVSQAPVPTVAASTLTPTGGAGLSTTPSSSTASSGASAVLTPTTATPTTAPVATTTTSTSTPTTGTSTVTTTTPTGTTTGTGTSPTGTPTTPAGTPTTPAGTPTTPAGTPTTAGDTPTTPVTDTNPSDTTAGSASTTTPVEP
jgi:RNA polymerase sigma factor (sigma-70 family)